MLTFEQSLSRSMAQFRECLESEVKAILHGDFEVVEAITAEGFTRLLDALAGFPSSLFYANVDRDVTGNWLIPPPSWEIARRPLAPLALYRDASERLKHDATVILPDLWSERMTSVFLKPLRIIF